MNTNLPDFNRRAIASSGPRGLGARPQATRELTVVTRWDEKAGLRTGCGVRSQVIDVLEAQEIKETGNEEG